MPILSIPLIHSITSADEPADRSFHLKKNFTTNFLLCGLSGWCMECFWTGMTSIRRHTDKELPCRTSIWMFPIYGMAAVIGPVSTKLKNHCTFVRGFIYGSGILATEFITGTILKRHQCCPWDYSKAKLNYKGVIRIDYFPAWMLAGLFFEKLVNREL